MQVTVSRSLRLKLLALIAVASGLAFACVAVAVIAYQTGTFRPRILAELNQQATILEEVLQGPLVFRDPESAMRYLGTRKDRPNLGLAAVYTRDGALFAEYRRTDFAAPTPAHPGPEGHLFAAGAIHLWRPIHQDGEVLGHLFLLEEMAPLLLRLPQYSIMVGGVVLALVIVGGVLMRGLRRNFLHPLTALVRTAAQVTEQDDYRIRARVHRADELGRLAGAFNQMLEVIGQRDASLRRSEERFRSLIANASDMITVMNRDALITFQSPSAERVLGHPPAEMTGRNAFDYVHPDDHARARETLARALATPGSVVTIEVRLRHRDGAWRLIEAAGRAIVREPEEPYVILNARDITESRKLEEHLRQSQKIEAIGQLSGGVAHDFNNILTVIQGHVAMLRTGAPLAPAMRDSVAEIHQAAERAANLTRQLLAFSRRQTMQLQTVDLNEVVSSLTRMLQRILGEDVEMQLLAAPRPVTVEADVSMMEQTLLNLAVNSRDAMPAGGRLVVATAVVEFDAIAAAQVAQARAGTFARLAVSDTGQGIPPEVLPRIFEPFFTTKPVGKGTGLGLATVFGIVQQHRGWINVTSVVGQGTTISVYFPHVAGAAMPLAPIPNAAETRGGNETILLVEDEPALRVLGRRVLGRLGYTVIDVGSGVEALEAWARHRDKVQLLLTDMVMPDGLTGRELAQRLQAECPQLCVVYTSGYSPDIAGRDVALEDGINFLPKPFSPDSLARIVRTSLDRAARA